MRPKFNPNKQWIGFLSWSTILDYPEFDTAFRDFNLLILHFMNRTAIKLINLVLKSQSTTLERHFKNQGKL